jgi:histidinol-phosphate/aromatic aminotransferase/cobyric acid decarboxylase-like protein
VVSLPGQVAAVRALDDADYYPARWRETGPLRAELGAGLAALGFDVVPGVANFVLCHAGDDAPDAAAVAAACRARGLYLRKLGDLGPLLGTRALRIAVKDAATNGRMLEILARVLGR